MQCDCHHIWDMAMAGIIMYVPDVLETQFPVKWKSTCYNYHDSLSRGPIEPQFQSCTANYIHTYKTVSQ